jgi:hypothetical protein
MRPVLPGPSQDRLALPEDGITMTTSPTAPADAGPHLDAIAAALARYGVGCRITRPAAAAPVLVTAPPAGPGGATVAIDPDPWADQDLRLDCTCVWTPPPGTAPEATAAAIAAVLAGSALTWPGRPPRVADATRLAAFLDGHPGWSAFWDKRYGLWRAAEDDPGSVLYAETPAADAVIAYITARS